MWCEGVWLSSYSTQRSRTDAKSRHKRTLAWTTASVFIVPKGVVPPEPDPPLSAVPDFVAGLGRILQPLDLLADCDPGDEPGVAGEFRRVTWHHWDAAGHPPDETALPQVRETTRLCFCNIL